MFFCGWFSVKDGQLNNGRLFSMAMQGLCSVIELFNLIFVRSVPTAALYPKVVAAAVVYLHFYILSSLYPFHGLMLMLCTSVCVYTMVYCLNHFEEPECHVHACVVLRRSGTLSAMEAAENLLEDILLSCNPTLHVSQP